MSKSALMVYEDYRGNYNVGDYIQSLAAKGFLPEADIFINREKLAMYKGEKAKLIMNGWFTHTKNNNWIPSSQLDTLFVAFHINNLAKKTILSKEGIAYLKSKEPIGCRDQNTVNLLQEVGVKAYFTGCLTLTLDRYKKNNIEREGIYIVDPLYNYPQSKYIFHSPITAIKGLLKGRAFQIGKLERHLRNIFTDELLKTAHYRCQDLPGKNVTDEQRFKVAENLLEEYSKAKLVITSRIHCALPCLAMGTPVIYINGFDHVIDTCRFDGILDLFNCINVNPKNGYFTANFDLNGKVDVTTKVKNSDKYLTLANNMKDICSKFTDS
ncbi:polysaccharide pyruvyl transferase family protein [Acinetobacter gandensis]|uniref:polysaccharide pyruvyl transferase family protein n=1 Tax=Acinetobacter gandensis TaxID=1443941 RepID=UPI003F57136A